MVFMKEKKKMSLAMQIFIALVLAIAAGLLLQKHAQFAETYIKPFGTIFLNLLKFIVVPIVLFSIMCGIISMRDIKKVGAIGLKTVVYYMCTTAFAITIGLIGGNLFKKMFPVIATTDLSYQVGEKTSLMDTIVNIFPSNFISPMAEANMLQVIVMALLIGFAIILVGEEKNTRIITACNDLYDAGYLDKKDYAILGSVGTKLRFSEYLPIEKVSEIVFTLRQFYNVGYFEATYYYDDKVMFFNDYQNRDIVRIFPIEDYKKMDKIDRIQLGVIYIGNNEKCLLDDKEEVFTTIPERTNCRVYELDEETKMKKLESIEKAKQLREKILNRDDKVNQEQRKLLV